MPSWLPLLVALACPLMMIFMMRGMKHGDHDQHVGHGGEQRTGAGVGQADARDERLAALEHEVAELRAARDQTKGNRR